MKTENSVKLATDATLKDAHFLRKHGSWYHDTEETVLVVDVQRSNFGQQHYINLGIFVKACSQTLARFPPKESECHIRLRLESLMPEADEESVRTLLDLDNQSIGSAERQKRIRGLVSGIAIPFLLQCSTRTGLRDAKRNGRLDAAVIDKRVREAIF
ncbi:DUF4304 domain-containing protein [Sorangium sp. So ce119]|uniref:DUF4304 domain-containing protein n=1 Tax=Sorangium sp. So ce119 TaxID=3133279 RepID=UPI003F6198D3